MALVTCSECEAKISDSAARCPRCGFPIQRQAPQQPSRKGKSRLWLWLTLGILVPALGCCTLFGGSMAIIQYSDYQKVRDSKFSPLVDLQFGEADVPVGPKTLATFQPKRDGKAVRVKLIMTDAYPFEIEPRRYELFEPSCTLTVRRDNDNPQAILAQTTTIDLVNMPFFKQAPLSEEEKKRYKGGYSRGSTGHMTVEFVPTDTAPLRVDFKGPGKGFKRYELHVDQKGL